MADDILHDDHWVTVFRRTPAVEEILKGLRVFLGNPGLREFRIRIGTEISPYTQWAIPDMLHTMGFGSYHMGGSGEMTVGNYCSIGGAIDVMGERHPIEFTSSSAFAYDGNKDNFAAIRSDYGLNWTRAEPPVDVYGPRPILEHDVWIGNHVTLARGIRIGTGAVVGTRSVVTKDVEPYMIVAGAPARPVRKRFDDRKVRLLLVSRWWEYANVFDDEIMREPDKFLPVFQGALAGNRLVPVPTTRITGELIKEKILDQT